MPIIDSSHDQDWFDVSADWTGETLVIRPQGDLDLATASSLSDSLECALAFRELSRSRVRVRLDRVSFIDASGYSSLVEMDRLAVERGVPLAFEDPSRSVARLFGVIGDDGQIRLTSHGVVSE